MGFNRRWRPSKKRIAEFKEAMNEIEAFIEEHGISASASRDSYYFNINGVDYRVSNHTIAASDRAAYDETTGERWRDSYHEHQPEGLVCITASKTRLVQIYNDLLAGKKLNKRGYVI